MEDSRGGYTSIGTILIVVGGVRGQKGRGRGEEGERSFCVVSGQLPGERFGPTHL